MDASLCSRSDAALAAHAKDSYSSHVLATVYERQLAARNRRACEAPKPMAQAPASARRRSSFPVLVTEPSPPPTPLADLGVDTLAPFAPNPRLGAGSCSSVSTDNR